MYCNCNSTVDAHGIENMTSSPHAVTHHLCLHMLKYQCRLNNRIYQHHGDTFREGFYLRTCLRLNSTYKNNNKIIIIIITIIIKMMIIIMKIWKKLILKKWNISFDEILLNFHVQIWSSFSASCVSMHQIAFWCSQNVSKWSMIHICCWYLHKREDNTCSPLNKNLSMIF